jgi:heat shock protein HslJ
MNNTIRALSLLAGLSILLTIGAGCSPTATPVPSVSSAPAGSTAITDIVWQWMSVTNRTTNATQSVPDPENYTIVFRTDGTVAGKADCNTFSGTYSQQNGFSINVTPTVMAACGTLDSQYLTLLKQVAAGGPDGAGNLALETAGGEQRMLFKNGGAAPKQ